MIKENRMGDHMEHTNTIKGICPKCGEDLEIPGHLQEFSCIYCGARLSPQDLRRISCQQPVKTYDAEACASYYEKHIMEVITNHLGIEKEMTKTRFDAAFDRYQNSNAEIFLQLDRAVSAGVTTPTAAASSFLDQLEARWDYEVSKKKRRSVLIDTDKFVIAIFLVPMVRKMKLSVSEDFCKALQEQWCQRHPKNPFYLGSYEELSGGFTKRFLGLCFITTAVCLDEGKADDCAELMAFRHFRDGYLQACPDGPALIQEYYDVAPGIVLRIDLSENRSEIYAQLRERFLRPCYEDLLAGRQSQCKNRYVEMVRELEQRYLQ